MESFKPNENFIYFLDFLSKRQEIFWNRYNGMPAPYTDDPVLDKHKFTNVYRVLDRSSQYLVSEIINKSDGYSQQDMLWRVLLYKHFNLPSTWETLSSKLDIRVSTPIHEIESVLDDIKGRGDVIYSQAYMLTAVFMKYPNLTSKYGINPFSSKHSSYLKIFKKSFLDGCLPEIMKADSLEQAYTILVDNVTGFGGFLAYQIVQDFNYLDFINWDDNSFCVAGPGTKRGIDRVFDVVGKPDYHRIVEWVWLNFEEIIDMSGTQFRQIPGHEPTVPDLSNCFCETDKYMRGLGVNTGGKKVSGKRIKQIFTESKSVINYSFPNKWGIKL